MRGVTLIEIMIVISLFGALAGISIGPGVDQFERERAQSDGTRLAAIARHARARAMHAAPHTLYWSEITHMLVVGGESDESYPLAKNYETSIGDAIHFSGPELTDHPESLHISTWAISTNALGAITLQHAL